MLSSFARGERLSLAQDRRLYAIGDVHGRLDLLTCLLDKIVADDAGRLPASTEIVLLGDLVDRGPDAAGVIRLAMTAEPAFTRLVTLKGNHESVMVAALAGDLDALANWLRFGGRETLESYGVPPDLLEGDDLPAIRAAAVKAVPGPTRFWLASLPLTYRAGDYLFVHAGIRPHVPLQEQAETDLLWIRDEFLQSRADFGMIVVHGHTPANRPAIRRNRIGIDTGAYFSDRLTALGLEGRRRWFLST